MINGYLANKADLDDATIHLLFSANRWEKRCALGQTQSPGGHPQSPGGHQGREGCRHQKEVGGEGTRSSYPPPRATTLLRLLSTALPPSPRRQSGRQLPCRCFLPAWSFSSSSPFSLCALTRFLLLLRFLPFQLLTGLGGRRSKLLEALQSGTTLVVDRYAYSGVAYSAAKRNPLLSLDWCKAPDVGLPAPDLVFYLRASVDATSGRGGFGEERYESRDLQQRVAAVFDTLHQGDPVWCVIDAAQPIDAIHEQIKAEVGKALARIAAGAPVRRLWDGAPLGPDGGLMQ